MLAKALFIAILNWNILLNKVPRRRKSHNITTNSHSVLFCSINPTSHPTFKTNPGSHFTPSWGVAVCWQTTYCIAESLKSVVHKKDLFYFSIKKIVHMLLVPYFKLDLLCTYPFKINSMSCNTLFQRVIFTNR